MYGSIVANYTNSKTVANEYSAGGILGYLDNSKMDNLTSVTSIRQNYYAGAIIQSKQYVGGVVGEIVKEIYDEDGKHIITAPRLSGSKGARFINWSPYIRLLAVKPAAMYNFSFLDLFTDTEIVDKITKLNSFELKEFLEEFADMIDNIGLNTAIQNVEMLLKKE